MKRILGSIPWVAIGQVIGSIVVIPIIYYMINKFYYPNKYNKNAELYADTYMRGSMDIKVVMPEYDSKLYLKNTSKDIRTVETFVISYDGNYFKNPYAEYIPFYNKEYRKYFNIMFFNYGTIYGYNGKEVLLRVNWDDMNNPEYGTKENPVPVLRMVGVKESIRDDEKDFDKTYMDTFYRNNVIRYLTYKMPKKEFKRRFKEAKQE